ncbi:MAG TPA: DUF202 domain-containing protein [Burkholderiales bacterium]|jgi:uncharacterized membrane protein YidH (DUF202 family)|nr:DUF202 domain-containing protein [Burkholderiales bacterium]HEX5464969.1 DUF202 domain-containing protein [Burkholderiales bacterium]
MPERQESEMITLALRQCVLAEERTEQSSERSYLNAERNLAVLVHAAVALMILGFAIDRYQLHPGHGFGFHNHFIAGTLTSWSAAALIGLGVLATFVGVLRYFSFILEYRRRHVLLLRYGPLLAPVVALLIAASGLAVLILLFAGSR